MMFYDCICHADILNSLSRIMFHVLGSCLSYTDLLNFLSRIMFHDTNRGSVSGSCLLNRHIKLPI